MPDGGFDLKEIGEVLDGLKAGFETYKEKNDERLQEVMTKGDADVLLKEQLERIDADLTKKQERLDQFEAAMKRKSAKVLDDEGNEVDLDQKAREWALTSTKLDRKDAREFGADAMAEYKAAFDTFVRKGERDVSDAEHKALSVGSDPDGGYVVHPDMSGQIVGFVYETSPIRQYASVQVISTDALEGLHDLDEASAGWVEETGSRSETTTPQLDKWRIPVHEVYAFPKATQKLLDDAAINMEAWLAGKVSDKFGRMENAAFVNGTGVTQPRGFLTYADWSSAGVYDHGKIEQFDTGVNGDFDTAANGGSDVLLDALYGLKAQYRGNAVWAMNRATAKKVRQLKDSDNNYLWAPGIAAGQPSTLMGYPVASFEDMPDPATNSLSIAVADWRATYQIVDRMGIRVLRDPYTAKPYVGFYSTKRVGGDVVNFDSIKLIKFAA